MEHKQFLEAIRACRRRLNVAKLLKILVFALVIGAGVGILFQVIAFIVPLYYANLYTGLAILLAVLAALWVAYIKRSSMQQAALVMDSFGFQERIVTAYEHLDKEGTIYELQRKDAMKQLDANRNRIKIRIWPSWQKLAGLAGLFVLLFVMMLVPSETKDKAKELHLIKEEADEKVEEIKEVVEGLEELEQETLTPEQLAALQEMMESLQSSMAEYQQANSAESLAAADQKLDYKYENMSNQLANLAQSLQNGASASLATAQSMQAMAQQLQEMSQSGASGQLASNQGQNSNSQNGQNSGQNSQSGNQSGQSGNQSGQSGQSGNQNGQNGQNGSQSGNQGGQSGNGQGSGNQSGNGQGSGGQNGQSGNGNGAGGGRGTGSSSSTHDYVSVPNAIVDSGNLTGNASNHDDSEFFRVQNGVSWEGTHVSHEAVIGSYEQNAYEGISAGKYPSGMEDVIKEYFSSFN